MVDPSDKGSEFDDISSKSTEPENQQKKTCADCGTTKTPLWRGGPAGPKSLCNACGIRSRKKRRDSLGLNRSSSANSDKKSRKISSRNYVSSKNPDNKKLGNGLKKRLLAIGREVLMQRSSTAENQRRKLGEEEQAAVLLMALSYGSVYALEKYFY